MMGKVAVIHARKDGYYHNILVLRNEEKKCWIDNTGHEWYAGDLMAIVVEVEFDMNKLKLNLGTQ